MNPPPKKAKPKKTSTYQQLWSLHWFMSACYLVIFLGGALMTRLPGEVFIRDPLYDFHKSMGVLTMALLTGRIFYLLRIYWSQYTRRQPKINRDWIRTFVLHAFLYIFMLVIPLTGFFLSNSFKSNNVRFFGIVLPDLFPQNSAATGLGGDLHFWLAYTFLACIILHTLEQRKFVRNWLRRTFRKSRSS